MGFWYSLLAVIAATAAVLVGVGRSRRLSIIKLVPMVLAHVCGLVLLIAGLLQWLFDPLAAVGEYGDGGGDMLGVVVPLVLVGTVLLSAAWFPALRRRNRRHAP